MAIRTSVGTGRWSVAGTWDTGVPVNGDTVIVAVGDTVTFDVDQSGFANGVDLTITGTLVCSTDAGTYYLMCSADIDGAGNFNAGSSETPLPSDVAFTIDFNGQGNSIEGGGGLTVGFYCTEPTHRYIRLSGAEAAGQTVLSVDTDVTGDIWADGDVIHINDVNKGQDSEERTIDTGGIAAGEITVTLGLTAAKIENALVILINRNIRITGSTDYAFYQCENSYIGCEVSGCTNGLMQCHYSTISGTVSGCTQGVFVCFGTTISGICSNCLRGVYYGYDSIFSGIFSGCNYAAILCANSIFSGVFSGCRLGGYQCHNSIFSGVFSGCNDGLNLCSNAMLLNALFGVEADGAAVPNARDIDYSAVGMNVILASATPVTTNNPMSTIIIDNLGYVNRDGYPDGSNGDPNIYHEWQWEGQIESVSAADSSRLMTPSSACGVETWNILDAALPSIPASGGDTISVSCTVTLNASQVADSVTLVIDPDGLYGGPVASVQATPQDAETELTVELTLDAGDYGAQVPVEIQVNDYAAGGEVTISAAEVAMA